MQNLINPYETMFLVRFVSYRPFIHRLIFQSPLCFSPSRPFSSSQIQNSDDINLVNYKDWLSPNEVIKIFQNLNDPNSALNVLNQISKRKDYKPNEAIYSVVVKNLAMAKNFDAIETLMEKIKFERKCRLSDEFFYNVIKIYGHVAGRINRAIETLFDMPNYKCWPSVRTFNFVLNLLVNTKQFDVVHKVYIRASELGVEIDACCLNIIIKGLCRCGELDAAFKVFDEFPKQNCQPNVRTFSTIMHALCERGRIDEALGLLERMEKEDVEPDAIVFNTLISGLRKQGRADEGIEMFKKVMLKGCDPNPGTYQEVLYALLDAKRYLEAKDFMAVMIDKRVNPSFESYKLIIHSLCDGKRLGDLDWALRQMVRHGFVPRMGMWRQILGCLFPDGDCCTAYSYEEILAD
uniref:Pentatricopeptide repeat-containing protein At3g14580, mitochondrial-like n=2 Tax=Nicotiana TaxID=4085 RepID=A0A1S4B6K9_TOBAC|nr:PREDICTED: pentatricopeptide repeat-containing protein At3g14580, mitochondrial-like [Nicotiana sylvestris]XP_009783782.1 PREDICTED: pentatricopeptide repeat-containing protein At3g14580, mitochondrial-like [Nicotiana sylvestris]XP_009783783.1 PREDICTED: pentatricopeptide repeat-containing protein At3g14580, mitochondrial-like [Nicotiana sylvestris]XP_016484585.1 PREDICTED: pentatricopeptide repeat-containing protein At3g14580, mitochondrial-like [Nicotiana tabacum]